MENGKWKMEDHETTDHETTPDSGSVVSGQWSVVSGQFSAFREATWDEALSLVAQRLAETKETHGSHAIGVLASAKCTNEENYLIQKFARAVVGTNNVDHCARL